MRYSVDEWAMDLVAITAKRSTCARRDVGCVILNSKNQVLATGYNGVPRGFAHCKDEDNIFNFFERCPGAEAESGTKLDACFAVHAEQNALLQCKDVWDIDTVYVSASPCTHCVKLLLNTSCRRIVFKDDYKDPYAKHLWLKDSDIRKWEKFTSS